MGPVSLETDSHREFRSKFPLVISLGNSIGEFRLSHKGGFPLGYKVISLEIYNEEGGINIQFNCPIVQRNNV